MKHFLLVLFIFCFCRSPGSLQVLGGPTTPVKQAFSKVLVAVGATGPFHSTADVEIIDLLSEKTTCQKPKDFPSATFFVQGGLGFNKKPIICGDCFKDPVVCHVYEGGAWKPETPLKQGRCSFGMSKSPFEDDGSSLFVTGGLASEVLDSSEVLTENGWQASVPLPVPIASPCMVNINSTSVMVIGGQINKEISGNTFIFDSKTNKWTEGPQLAIPREDHNCGTIRENDQIQEKSVIVVGGDGNSGGLSSVEVLDLNSNAWRKGPELPFPISTGALVEDPSGGVVLIGGAGNLTILDTLFKLPHAGADAKWEEMPQHLKFGRTNHVAILIPDQIASCN